MEEDYLLDELWFGMALDVRDSILLFNFLVVAGRDDLYFGMIFSSNKFFGITSLVKLLIRLF